MFTSELKVMIGVFPQSKPMTSCLVKNLKILLIASLAVTTMLSTSSCGLVGFTARTAISLIPLKLMFKCLPEGEEIDTPEGPRAVESLRPGDIVIGFKGEPVKVLQIQGYAEDDEAEEFMTVEFVDGATVELCEKHRIHGVRAKNLEIGDQLKSGHVVKSITKYGGVERSYDILTEDKGYQINGVPVNSMIEEMYEAGHQGKIKEN